MLTKGTAYVDEINGQLGGAVFSKGRYGTYARQWRKPVKPGSEYAQQRNTTISYVGRKWRTLSDAQRLTWTTWAQENPIVDRMGNLRIMTGQQTYSRLNTQLYDARKTTLVLPPTTTNPDPLHYLSITYDSALPHLASVTFTLASFPTNWKFIMRGAAPRHLGKKDNSRITRTFGYSTLNPVSPYSFGGAWALRFGEAQAGQCINISMQILNWDTGQVSLPYTAETLAT